MQGTHWRKRESDQRIVLRKHRERMKDGKLQALRRELHSWHGPDLLLD
jgi:hypothetical protein